MKVEADATGTPAVGGKHAASGRLRQAERGADRTPKPDRGDAGEDDVAGRLIKSLTYRAASLRGGQDRFLPQRQAGLNARLRQQPAKEPDFGRCKVVPNKLGKRSVNATKGAEPVEQCGVQGAVGFLH